MEIETKCGGSIFITEKALEHLEAHRDVLILLPRAIKKVLLPANREYLSVEIDMGEIVGLSKYVSTPVIDLDVKSLFAKRINRVKPSRIILDVPGQETTKITIHAFVNRVNAGQYILATAYIGELAPKEPWDANLRKISEKQESLDFWTSHALVYDPEIMGEYFESSWRDVINKHNC